MEWTEDEKTLQEEWEMQESEDPTLCLEQTKRTFEEYRALYAQEPSNQEVRNALRSLQIAMNANAVWGTTMSSFERDRVEALRQRHQFAESREPPEGGSSMVLAHGLKELNSITAQSVRAFCKDLRTRYWALVCTLYSIQYSMYSIKYTLSTS
jgi:hypothetical protein